MKLKTIFYEILNWIYFTIVWGLIYIVILSGYILFVLEIFIEIKFVPVTSIAGKFNFMLSLIGFLLIYVFLMHIFSLLSCIFKLKEGIILLF